MGCFRNLRLFLQAAAVVLCCGAFLTVHAEDGYQDLFNGKDLTGWDGNPELWSVQDGAITGVSDGTLKVNQFISWTGGSVDDFELKLEFRMEGNSNSGVQYRSHRMPTVGPWVVGGYQADIHPNAKYTAMLYEERGRGILVERGQKVTISKEGKKEVSALPGTFDKVDLAQWHALTIRGEGIHLIHQLDGVTVMDLTDAQEPGHELSGIIALQLHVGPPMKVQFRNIRLRSLKPAAQKQSQLSPRTPEEALSRMTLPAGFRVERLSSNAGVQPASWKILCAGPAGSLFVTDEEGRLFRVVPVKAKSSGMQIEQVKNAPRNCRSLLWAFDSLYVVAASSKERGLELYRLRDRDGNKLFETAELLRKLPGSNQESHCELVAHPDQPIIDVICGTGLALPEIEQSRVPQVWDEDALLPRLNGNGALKGIPAPGGYVARMQPDGKNWELVAIGLGHPRGAVVHADGELLLCDADSPRDAEAPWLRPVRLCHVQSGSDFGWRSGSAKHPEYYPETSPSILHMNHSDPAGACFGYGTEFPERYQRALFVCDGKLGKIHAIDLSPDGATYRGRMEEFFSTPDLPIRDIAINAQEGTMYLTIGGTETGSGLYRIVSSAQPALSRQALRSQRSRDERAVLKSLQQLQNLHGMNHSDAVQQAWPFLSHADPALRAAARTAIEFRPADSWASQAMNEQNVQAKLESLLALCRSQIRESRKETASLDPVLPDWDSFLGNSLGAKGIMQVGILTSLSGLDWTSFNFEQRMLGLRIVQLSLLRFGPPDTYVREGLLDALGSSLPAKRVETNSLLLEIVVYLQSPQAASQGMELLQAASTVDEQILYAKSLVFLRAGWSPDLRMTFFRWCDYHASEEAQGTLSRCVAELQQRAFNELNDAEKKELPVSLQPRAIP